jgi:SIR2-like domain
MGDPDIKTNGHRVRLGGGDPVVGDDVGSLDELGRGRIESWLAALLQAEHLSLLIGNGLGMAVGGMAGQVPPTMSGRVQSPVYADEIEAHAVRTALDMGRQVNVEDRIRCALALIEGLTITGDTESAAQILAAVDSVLRKLIDGILGFERTLRAGYEGDLPGAVHAAVTLQRFLLPFASRATGRDRLNIFTTNYDRLIEYAADLLGLRLIDRFVGTLEPQFSASRLELDMHYSPPGVRGEPRYLEGVVRYSKLHGSVDWRARNREIVRAALPFGAQAHHPEVPEEPSKATMIYPNPAKDVETLAYPYAELFRDFAAAVCRPNAVLVTYGYGFGDSHINRVISSMLALPSTHLVVISRDPLPGLEAMRGVHFPLAQSTELIGDHVAGLTNLVELLPSLSAQGLMDAQRQYADRKASVDALSGTRAGAATEIDPSAVGTNIEGTTQ